MKRFELVAFDIDGTLTASKAPLEESPLSKTDMSDLLNQLFGQYKVAFTSGASFKQFETQILSHLTQDPNLLNNLYLLPTNGTTLCTYENNRWHCPETNALTEDEKQKIYQALEQMTIALDFAKPDKLYGIQTEDRGSQITFSALGQEAPLEAKHAWDPDHVKRGQMVSFLSNLLPEFAVHLGGSTSVDITRQGIDKAYGLRNLLKHLNLEGEKLLYIGDELTPQGNDAPAMEVAGVTRSVKSLDETKRAISDLLAQSER